MTAFVRTITALEGDKATVGDRVYTVVPGMFEVGELVIEVAERDEILPLTVLGEGYFLVEEDEDVSDVVK